MQQRTDEGQRKLEYLNYGVLVTCQWSHVSPSSGTCFSHIIFPSIKHPKVKKHNHQAFNLNFSFFLSGTASQPIPSHPVPSIKIQTFFTNFSTYEPNCLKKEKRK